MSGPAPTLPSLVLEVNTAALSASLCRNASAKHGLARWTTTTVTPDARGFYMGADTAATTMTYEPVAASPGQWVGTWYAALATPYAGAYRQVFAYVSFWNASNVQIGAEVMVRNQIWDGGPPISVGGSGSNPGAALAPSGTVTARIRYASPADAGSTSIWVNRIAIRVASTQSAASAPLPVPVWTTITNSGLRVDVEGGAVVEGVDDVIEPGALVAVLTDPSLDPATSTAFRRGNEIRLKRANGDLIWSGVVENADADYRKDNRLTVTVVATDAGRALHDATTPTLPGGTFSEQIAAACYSAGLGARDTAGNFLTASTGIASREDNASAATWVKRIVATHGGAVWIDADGIPRAVASPSTTPVTTLSDNPADSGLKYTDISLAYGSRSLVNALTVKRINEEEDEPQGKVYGPYIALESDLAYGRVSAEVEIVGGSPSTIASRILGVYSEPRRFPSEVTVNALDDLNGTLAITPYSAVRVKRSTLFNDVVRVLKVVHNITPTSWFTTFYFKPLETPSTVDVLVPSAGADTGPGDVAGAGFPRLARRSRSTTVNTTSGTSLVVLWNQELSDEGIAYSAANGRFTIPRNGRYMISASLTFPANATGARVVDVRRNGSALLRGRVAAWASTDNIVSASAPVRLSANDYLDVVALQNSGSTLALQADTNSTFVSIAYIGP